MPRAATVLLGPFSSQSVAEGLRALLSVMAEVTVVPVDDPDVAATDQADRGGPAVLVVAGRDPAACRQYLDDPMIRMDVLVDPPRGHGRSSAPTTPGGTSSRRSSEPSPASR